MTRGLKETQVATLFWRRYGETRDAEAAALAVYEAGLAAAGGGWAMRHRRSMSALAVRAQASPVLAAVADRHGLTVNELFAVDRGASSARFEVMWILRQKQMSYPAIAVALEFDNHSSCIYGVRLVEARIAKEPGLREELLRMLDRASARRAA